MSQTSPDWSDAMSSAGEWTPDLVAERIEEAMRWCQQTAGRAAPKEFGSSMPEVLAWLDPDLAGWSQAKDVRRGADPAAVTRMEAVLQWPLKYLDAFPGPRGMLKIWMLARASRQPWSRLLRERGVPLATAKRARSKALAAIAQRLNRDEVPIG